jgi:deoxyribodipyrimidine photolyase
MMHNRGLMVFRQDIRVSDNSALARASVECDQLLCVFVFDENII